MPDWKVGRWPPSTSSPYPNLSACLRASRTRVVSYLERKRLLEVFEVETIMTPIEKHPDVVSPPKGSHRLSVSPSHLRHQLLLLYHDAFRERMKRVPQTSAPPK